MPYNVVRFHWATERISHTCTYIPLLLNLPCTHHPTRLGLHRGGSWAPWESWAVYFTRKNVYMSVLPSQFIPPSPSLAVCRTLFPTSASVALPCKYHPQYHFSRFQTYVLIHSACFFFLSYWHSSLCITLGFRFIRFSSADASSFLFYGWVIFHWAYVPYLLYPFIRR